MAHQAPRRPNPIVIGVAGGSGSGKTTIARGILSHIGEDRIAYIQHDAYYRDLSHLPLEERQRQNFDHPDALENELLLEHLHTLRQHDPIALPVYDFSRHIRRPETERLEPAPLILIEGILIFATAELREMMDIKIYVDTDADIRFIRRLRRDMQERGRSLDTVVKQYLGTVRPMHIEFVEPSKRFADIIVPEGGYNQVALDMICSRIERMLE